MTNMEPFLSNRRTFLQSTLLASMVRSTSFGEKKANRPPNIILIMADDFGYECLGCNGGTTYNTPNIDALANTGIRFTHCYSNPVCSPSRVNLMTGRYTFRSGTNTSLSWGTIPDDERTFGHIVQQAGYATALAGKWQMTLLKENPHHVKQMGFEESSCWAWHEGPRYFDPWVWQNGKLLNNMPDKYGPDVYCDFLLQFIEKNVEQPFLAYYPMTLSHFPKTGGPYVEPPPKGGVHKTFKEMVEYADQLVERIVQKLDALHLREHTLILFTGDNGTPKSVTSNWNGQSIKGGKGEMSDAGTHVPLIANWKGTSPNGVVNESLIDFSDFFATIAELAQTPLPSDRVIDGKSFVPQLKGKEVKGRDWVYTEWNGKKWIRNHRWKLYESGELYDILSDKMEEKSIPIETMNKEANMARSFLQNALADLRI